jgi:hypothetical protein
LHHSRCLGNHSSSPASSSSLPSWIPHSG